MPYTWFSVGSKCRFVGSFIPFVGSAITSTFFKNINIYITEPTELTEPTFIMLLNSGFNLQYRSHQEDAESHKHWPDDHQHAVIYVESPARLSVALAYRSPPEREQTDEG